MKNSAFFLLNFLTKIQFGITVLSNGFQSRKWVFKRFLKFCRKTSDSDWGWNEENWSETSSKPAAEKPSQSKKSTKKAATANNDDLLIDFGSEKAAASKAEKAKKSQEDSWASWENDAWESLNK